MKTMSAMVSQRLAAADVVVVAAREHASDLSASLHDVLGLPAEQIRALLVAQADLLERACTTLKECEHIYIEEQDDDVSLRGRIAEAGIELDQKLRMVRENIRTFESEDALAIYGLDEAPPRAREALVGYAANAIQQLRAHPYQFTGELGQVIDTRKVAVLLGDLLEPFETLVAEMSEEMNQLREALDARNSAVDIWTDTYQGVAGTLEGMLRLARKYTLADSIHPSFIRKHATDED